ncbi:cache domain-containing protein [Noviherbaspirillum sp.]|uniref:cache domain-containing protein n=1 Tax=Noviherbaspirillum sp. TaxID=1926288 RepID=UPI002B468142|nr:cache domain-containing protein [Noviherbaspirillum sp.]HJV79420.1 cache domain-containing protein [Noviherbaspirillum sp.]
MFRLRQAAGVFARTASSSELKDADNKPFIKEILAKAGSVGRGRVNYEWVNPASNAIQQKSAYPEKAEDVVITTGFYKN